MEQDNILEQANSAAEALGLQEEAPAKLPRTPAVEVTEEQKENFFKAFISDSVYHEEFLKFGDKFKIKLKTLTVEENNDILEQISFDQAANLAKNSDAYFLKVIHYRLALALVSINNMTFAEGITKATVKQDGAKAITYVSERAKQINSWQLYKVTAIQDAYSEFERRVLKLTDEVSNPDFWKAAA